MAISMSMFTKSIQLFSNPYFASLQYSKLPSQEFLFPTKSANASTITSTSNLIPSRLLMRAFTSDFGTNKGEIFGDVTILTAAGEPVMFKDLWDQNQGMAVVAVLRHFGCPCYWELASGLKKSKSKLDSADVKLIAIGVGAPNKARILAERLPFPMDCLYADPDRKTYDVLGLYYGFGRTFFNPASAKVFSRFDALRKAIKNYAIEATPDNRSGVLQQGGMFVFRGKRLLYVRKDEGTGDHAPLDDVLNICCEVPIA